MLYNENTALMVRQYAPLKRRSAPRLHGAVSQKAIGLYNFHDISTST
jgi:hypothetical protein